MSYKINEINTEYQLALTMLQSNRFIMSEDLNTLNIKIASPDLHLLKRLHDELKSFEVYPNVKEAGYTLSDLIDDLQSQLITIGDVNFVLLEFDKKAFVKHINHLDYMMFTNDFFKSFKKINEPLDHKVNILQFISNEDFSTQLFNVYSIYSNPHEFKRQTIETQKAEELTSYLSHNKHINQSSCYNPFAFRVINYNNNQDSLIIEEVKKLFYLCFIEALSDSFIKDTYILNTKKKISIHADNNFSTNNFVTFTEIFDFLVTDHKYTEKYIIVKKVLTMYTQSECTISDIDLNLENIWKTARNYYDDYIEDNIRGFFENKDQLLKEATSISQLVYDQTDKVNNSIIASLLTILVVFATTLFRQVGTVSLLILIFITILLIIFSYTYYFIVEKSSTDRYKLTKAQFEYFIGDVSFIDATDLKKIRKTYLDQPYKNLINTLNIFRNILLAINALAILIVTIVIFIDFL